MHAITSPAYAHVTLDDDGTIAIAWGGADPLFEQRLRDVKGRTVAARWSPSRGAWLLAPTIVNVSAVVEIVSEYAGTLFPFTLAPGAREQLEQRVATAQRTLEQSSATTGTIALDTRRLRNAQRLRPFQLAGIAHAVEHRQTIIADEMGLGKSAQSIVAVEQTGSVPCLIVCPANLKLNWRRELQLWSRTDRAEIAVLSGTRPGSVARQQHRLYRCRYVIVNHEILKAWLDVLTLIAWRGLIVDEAHAFKTPDTQRAIALRQLVQLKRPETRLLLTGTPVLNRPVELWELLEHVDGQRHFGGWWRYTDRYCAARQTAYGRDVSGASNLDELNRTLRASGLLIRRRKRDVMTELPPAEWQRISLPMTGDALREYERAEDDLYTYLAEQGRSLDRTAETLVQIGVLRQLSWRAKRDAAYAWIDDMLASGRKLVVFAWHRETVDEIAARYRAPKIVGGMTAKRVEAAKTRFQENARCKLIACNIAAGGVGHTLTAASDVAFVEYAWNASLMDQALARADRIGQTERVTGWVLAGERESGETTIDDLMLEMIADKGLVTSTAIDGLGLATHRASMRRIAQQLADREQTDG